MSPALAFVFLGTLFNVNSLFVNLPVAWLAARAGKHGRESPGVTRILQGLTGTLFVFLAARLAGLERD
jgi:threonine/homoserine/homoserine lactone efflux protein